jgi:hypothetical protein
MGAGYRVEVPPLIYVNLYLDPLVYVTLPWKKSEAICLPFTIGESSLTVHTEESRLTTCHVSQGGDVFSQPVRKGVTCLTSELISRTDGQTKWKR